MNNLQLERLIAASFLTEQLLGHGVRIDERHGGELAGRECIAGSTTSTAAAMRG